MKNYYYSAASNAFYPVTLRDDYERSGTWPTDGVPVDEDVFCEFACAPAPHGKTRVVGPDGLPAGRYPTPSAEQVLADAMALRASLMAQATTAIAPLQDAADLGMATGRKAPSLLSGNAIECCCCALMSRRVSRRKSTGRHNLNSPPSAGFLRLRNGRQRCTPNTGATTCMKTKQQWSRWVSVPAGQLLWADLERMGGYGHPVLCCFADWASAAEVLAPGAGWWTGRGVQ